VWWGTEVECVSAISRRERGDDMSPRAVERALHRLDLLKAQWNEIEPSEPLRRAARRLLRVHGISAADALQLAAAIRASADLTEALEFVSLDARLSEAAAREGFPVLDSSTG
jgi:uncharacterized protein